MIYELLIMTVGWLYPAFATYNCLNGNLRSQVPWMKYWIVFGLFNAFHYFTAYLEPWVPCLSGFKLFVLCWLLPNVGSGCQLIYDEVVDPLLKRNKQAITLTVDGISTVSSSMMRELVKMIYHLMVDVVEQCWLMTRNANDINVTPRLQTAINEVIGELRAARQAAIFMPGSLPQAVHLPLEGGTLSIAGGPSAFRAAAASEDLPNDLSSLSVLLAESLAAERMQLLQLIDSQMHLVSSEQTLAITMPERPLKPKRGKRKSLDAAEAARRAQQLEQELDVERAYQEYCEAAQEREHEHEHEHEQRGGEKVAEQH
ncbi:PREDICTED: uncharacterized protein LOC108619120 [Drosophila arizonae]|uniref:Receptor expression-enhancing protein n=1 Tax=Drosophila arizonae TaxID=7263 RepID=A0ABM1PUR9_DROAR|nr:PREDICTED: uncharacterized protein LOC108619120 [Drosophila arizonae]